MSKKSLLKNQLVGRKEESAKLQKAIGINKHVLIEGPVGVGKTFLVEQVLESCHKQYVRLDGDARYTEQKLTGWFDPSIVLKKGYSAQAFVEGPLAKAMQNGIVLFVNELNRLPEGVQNVLLPTMDERLLILPKLEPIAAQDGFLIIATQNPREFTATHSISEALSDRFEVLFLDYQSADDETQIVQQAIHKNWGNKNALGDEINLADRKNLEIIKRAVEIVRATRNHPAIKRGASVRAAISIVSLLQSGLSFEQASLMALPTRIELVSPEDDVVEIIKAMLNSTASSGISEKKKELRR